MWSAQNYSWIVMLIFTPLVLDLVGGPKNGTVICLFSWAVCSSLFIMIWFVRTEPAKWACSIINGVVSGITAPLAFTGTEVYTERAAVLLARQEFAEAEAEKKEDPTVASAEATPKSLSKNIVARRKREGELVDRMVGVLFGISQIFTVIFQIPSAAGLMSDPYTYDTLWSLVGFTCCIFLFFLVSLMIPNIPSQDHGEKNDKEEEGKNRNCCATVGPKAISIFVVLGQYRGCAALAIVGWYFFNSFGQGYVSLSASPPFLWL